jgi:hypothetical protein
MLSDWLILFTSLELGDGFTILFSKMTKRSDNEQFLPNNILLTDPGVVLYENNSPRDSTYE